MRRNPRAGLRDRWVEALLEADIGRPCLLLALLLAHKMGDHGKVSIPRKDLAAMLRVHEQRIAERIGELRAKGLLDIVGGTGVRGRVAQYVACIPHSGTQYVPDSGTQSGRNRYGLAVRTFGTHSLGESDTCVPDSGTHNTRALEDATSERNNNGRDSRTDHITEERSEEEVAARSPLAAFSRFDQARAAQ